MRLFAVPSTVSYCLISAWACLIRRKSDKDNPSPPTTPTCRKSRHDKFNGMTLSLRDREAGKVDDLRNIEPTLNLHSTCSRGELQRAYLLPKCVQAGRAQIAPGSGGNPF